ncbi:MAG: GTP cyclohydrolase I FolE2 [Dechloromonas sp.]|jgi:GTP cyclohydrolase I|nr:GTP cyclohydrolase I FolE2 [Dechloromonas sp.]
MNAPEHLFLPDVQSFADQRALAIQHVGVRGLRYPLRLRTATGESIATVATATMTVGLPSEVKGTHMSRFVELLEQHLDELSVEHLPELLFRMLRRLDASSGRIELAFPYFIRKTAPVSGVDSLLDYDTTLIADQREGERPQVAIRVVAPVTSLCPCSKKISAYGAHNQRSHITLEATLREPMSIEELVRLAEEEASCEVFGLLKRPDEKWVTERAYENPKFVEDLVRDVALRLMAEPRVAAWKVASENFESIHNHSAYAELSGCND